MDTQTALRINLNWSVKHDADAMPEAMEQLKQLGILICPAPKANAGNTKALKQIKALYSIGIFETCKYLYQTYGPATMIWYAKAAWNLEVA